MCELTTRLYEESQDNIDSLYYQAANEIENLKAELERVREKVLWPPNPQSWTVIRIRELEKLERQLAEARAEVERLKEEIRHYEDRQEAAR